MSKTINILGVTGSIGRNTADVILSAPEKFQVNVITAHQDADGLAEMAEQLGAKTAILISKDKSALHDALSEPVDLTVAAIMGMAGLKPLMQAIKHSKAVAIANKEPLVSAGPQVLDVAKMHNTRLLPLDSEHNAIFQVFDEAQKDQIERLVLTASGGPFREFSLDEMRSVTPEQALKHPNWSMGQKISIDSATLMNKGLEIIEAHYLFDMPVEKIDVLMHPQSIVHSMVEYSDGSMLAQLGPNDMRTPISYALAWPQRMKTSGPRLDLAAMKNLTFDAVDTNRFKSIPLTYAALQSGQGACLVMNAANEVAVESFLTNRIGFLDIIEYVERSLDKYEDKEISSLEEVIELDHSVRTHTYEMIQQKAA